MLHDRNPPYVLLSDGGVRNGYTVKILNKLHEPREFALRRAACRARSSPSSAWSRAPTSASTTDDLRELRVFVTVPRASPAQAGRRRARRSRWSCATRPPGTRPRAPRTSRSRQPSRGGAHEPDDLLARVASRVCRAPCPGRLPRLLRHRVRGQRRHDLLGRVDPHGARRQRALSQGPAYNERIGADERQARWAGPRRSQVGRDGHVRLRWSRRATAARARPEDRRRAGPARPPTARTSSSRSSRPSPAATRRRPRRWRRAAG